MRFVESVSLVASALAGGVIASLASTRVTYFLTVPFAVLSVLALLRFREPCCTRRPSGTSLRAHIALTYRTLTRGGHLLPVVTLAVLTAVLLQVIFEFGPLWLIALSAPASVFGPFWAALVATLGLGGLLAGRLGLDRPARAGRGRRGADRRRPGAGDQRQRRGDHGGAGRAGAAAGGRRHPRRRSCCTTPCRPPCGPGSPPG